jgi:hypothetical protein
MRPRLAVIRLICAGEASRGGMFNRVAISQGPLCTNLLAEEQDPFCLSMGLGVSAVTHLSCQPIEPPTGGLGGNMASAATADRDRERTKVSRTQRVVSHDETKPSFKTTELFTMLGIVAAS